MKLTQIVSQLESCGFACEAGSLENNDAFIALKERAEIEAAAEAEAIRRKNLIKYDCKKCGQDTHYLDANYCTGCGTKIEATAGTTDESQNTRCEYLGCQNSSFTKTEAKDWDGSMIQYQVCEEHVGQMDHISMVGKIVD